MNMNMNGVNHWVTNVCELLQSKPGKLNETEIEICLRWTEVAAFLPMLHVSSELLDALEGTPQMSKVELAMGQRGQYTRYIYSQMFATNYTGGQLVYPLLYDFPQDDEAMKSIEDSYMLGDSMKVSPRIDP